MRRTSGLGQDIICIYARFPRSLYEQLQSHARVNMRSVGKECVVLCEAALREREKDKQKQHASNAVN